MFDDIEFGEVFYLSPLVANYNRMNADHATEYTLFEPGWYVADLPAIGPFATKEEALKHGHDDHSASFRKEVHTT